MHKKNDREFFEENILIHCDRIFKYALSVTKEVTAAEDIMQQTLEKAWTRLSQLRDRKKAKAWVFQIARNEIRLHFREEKKQWSGEAAFQELLREASEQEMNPEILHLEEQQSREEKIQLAQAIERLPEKYREILMLWSQGNLSEKEISEVLGMNYSTVRVTIHRGLECLRKLYFMMEGGGANGKG